MPAISGHLGSYGQSFMSSPRSFHNSYPGNCSSGRSTSISSFWARQMDPLLGQHVIYKSIQVATTVQGKWYFLQKSSALKTEADYYYYNLLNRELRPSRWSLYWLLLEEFIRSVRAFSDYVMMIHTLRYTFGIWRLFASNWDEAHETR